MENKTSSDLPPGFRFHPTDEELIMFYLRNQAKSKPCPASIIPEVDIYKFDPWQLPDKAGFGENEWYFFTPRDRKYPNGIRPNRATLSGYWKATGTDKAIYSGSKYVGVKKALVFYKGKPPKGVKTDWIMHEYRLSDSRVQISKQNGSMRVSLCFPHLLVVNYFSSFVCHHGYLTRTLACFYVCRKLQLDDWVLCRIYKKKNSGGGRVLEQKGEEPNIQTDSQQMLKFPRTSSVSHLLELDYMGPVSQLFGENTYEYNTSFEYFPHTVEETPYQAQQVTDSGLLNQQVNMNPMLYPFQ